MACRFDYINVRGVLSMRRSVMILTNLPWNEDNSWRRLAPPSAATRRHALAWCQLGQECTCSAAGHGEDEMATRRTVLPQASQGGAVLERLIENQKSKFIGAVMVLEQLRRMPLEARRRHVGTRSLVLLGSRGRGMDRSRTTRLQETTGGARAFKGNMQVWRAACGLVEACRLHSSDRQP